MNIKMIKTIKAEIKRDSIQNKNQNELKPLFRKRTTKTSRTTNMTSNKKGMRLIFSISDRYRF